MDIMISIYLIGLLISIISLIYLDGLKEGIINSLSMIIIALIWLFIERLIDKQFDSITIIVCLIAVCMTVIFFWLRKKLSYSLSNEKKRKKKK
jgi:Ca2+/Na+ antiporter